MVRKSVHCGQRTGNTLRKHFLSFVSRHGYVHYNFLNTPWYYEHEKYQKLYSRKDEVLADGRKSHLELSGDSGDMLEDAHLDIYHREGTCISYSLDKHQRWMLPSMIKDNIESFAEEDFRVVLSERKTLTLFYHLQTDFNSWFRTWNDCAQYVDSKTPLKKATSRKFASFFCDLRKNCMGGGHIERKPRERKRKRHNLHSRGIQRKSELRQKAQKVKHEDKYSRFT
jgi:hypothetical protein